MIHTWTDGGVTYQLGQTEDGHLGVTHGGLCVYQTPMLAREILRLAQREANLQHGLDAWKRTAETCSDAAAKHLARVRALERENREKTLELAEKAGRIRELEESLKAANEENNLLARKHPVIVRLQAAVEDGIAHVERARTMVAVYQEGIDQITEVCTLDLQPVQEALDLAHEALSGAVVPRTGGAPVVPEPPCDGFTAPQIAVLARLRRLSEDGLADVRGRLALLEIFRWGIDDRTIEAEDHLADLQRRVITLESDLGKLGAATNPAGKPPAYARLDSLEESRGHHAVMLSDHADRLVTIEQTLRGWGERITTWHPYFRNGIAALEKIVSRITGELEGLKARTSALEAGKE